MSRLKDLSVVRTKADFAPDAASTRVIPAGTQGTVVHVHDHHDDLPDFVEVEFLDLYGTGAPGVFTMPESILALVPASSNLPKTEFLPENLAAVQSQPIECLKFCCQKCGHRWTMALPALDAANCMRCGTPDILPYGTCRVPAPPPAVKPPDDVTDAIVAALNSALEADPVAISVLFGIRIPCNETLAEHPTVQVWAPPRASVTVGTMGIVNAVASAATGLPPARCNGNGLVALEWDIETSRVLRFFRFPTAGVGAAGTVIIL